MKAAALQDEGLPPPVEVSRAQPPRAGAPGGPAAAAKAVAKPIAPAGAGAAKKMMPAAAAAAAGGDAAKKRAREGEQQANPSKRTRPPKWTVEEDTALLAGLWHKRTKFDEILKLYDAIFGPNKRTVPGLASRYQVRLAPARRPRSRPPRGSAHLRRALTATRRRSPARPGPLGARSRTSRTSAPGSPRRGTCTTRPGRSRPSMR